MNRLFSAKPLIAAAVALGAVVAGSAAHARSEVHFSIGFHQPYTYVQPAPVYVQPQTYYVQPQTYYAQPQTYYVQPQAQTYYYNDRRHVQRAGAWGDRDGDGVPNYYDRDSRRWDADGDGVANRYDRFPHNPYRH